MAMALFCSSPLVAPLSSLSVSSSCTASSSSVSQWKLPVAPLSGHTTVLSSSYSNARVIAAYVPLRTIVVKASEDVIEASVNDASAEPAPAITTMLSESELLKRKAKKEELRRKRLVRKRKLRKKGKWPPSKMAKLKNV
ncbi:uncharacterized protein [Physcomitrium patens]|uniref:50S ribosomal protein 5, chloroplastic n=1 Tax=Physcomitrium patens TaxID=3218 RepID=A9RL53_PHYPA|nr:50S ribosomal protein 5, chloroplastic-like [Physcomitrium patens]PNR37796.1 hypothetical protein PHYPA_020905 [Physcomitrium patens]|eukprot:XP_024397884.1 50S ribosomal protein 5, chloroplastic-like [Physcomitrella patens]